MAIAQLRNAGIGSVIWDRDEKGSVSGLHLRSFPEKKVFYLYYRTRTGKQRRPKIGVFGDITLSEARRRARAILDEVAVGKDPKGSWDQARAEAVLREVWGKAFEDYWSQDQFEESGWRDVARRLWEKNIEPAFGGLRLSEVSTQEIRKWHSSMRGKPYAANRSLAVLSKLFTYAEEAGLKPTGLNPCELVKKHPEKSRERFASMAELQKLAPILKRDTAIHPESVAFVYTMLFTGSRPKALEKATWDQLRIFEAEGTRFGRLTFHGKSSSKTGKEEVVIIPPQALEILEKFPRVRGKTIGLRLSRKWWDRIRTEMGCEDLRFRDFRRTYATIALSTANVGAAVMGELLNHQTAQTTKIYAKLLDTSRVTASFEVANRVQKILGGAK